MMAFARILHPLGEHPSQRQLLLSEPSRPSRGATYVAAEVRMTNRRAPPAPVNTSAAPQFGRTIHAGTTMHEELPMTNLTSGTVPGEWMIAPPEPGEVSIHFSVGAGTEVTPVIRDALTRIANELEIDDTGAHIWGGLFPGSLAGVETGGGNPLGACTKTVVRGIVKCPGKYEPTITVNPTTNNPTG
jgi:hypothetical protein